MSFQAEAPAIGPRDHVVHFYARDDHLMGLLAQYVGDSVRTGAVTIAIAARGPGRADALTARREGRAVGSFRTASAGLALLLGPSGSLGEALGLVLRRQGLLTLTE